MGTYVRIPTDKAEIGGIVALAVLTIIGYKLIANRIVPPTLKI